MKISINTFSTIGFSIPRTRFEKEVILAYYKVRHKGLGGKGVTAIFPKLNYCMVEGYNKNPGDPHYDLSVATAILMSKKYFPDVLHFTKEQWDAGLYTVRMGCRSKPKMDENMKLKYGRFNYGM